MSEEPNERLKEWRAKLGKVIGTPKSHQKPGGGWGKVNEIAAKIIIFNLMAFCALMAFLILTKVTEPTSAPSAEPTQSSNVFERAQKHD